MRTARLFLAIVLTGHVGLAGRVHAQVPMIDSSAVALRYTPLPVYDDFGLVIPEDLIRATLRDGGRQRRINLVISTLAGAALFALLSPDPLNGADCSIYDPCTPRERYYKDHAAVWGLGVGFIVGFALPDGSVDRWEAVERLRAQRRAAQDSTVRVP
jgi:hypothetical protein